MINTAAASVNDDANANVILNRELEVNSGVEIEHSIKIEVVEVKTDIIDCAKLRISSYQKPARVISIFQGDKLTEYETSSGAIINIKVLSVYGDSVYLRVTGPEDWRVTNYYTVESEEEEETKEELKELMLEGAEYRFKLTKEDLKIKFPLDNVHVIDATSLLLQ